MVCKICSKYPVLGWLRASNCENEIEEHNRDPMKIGGVVEWSILAGVGVRYLLGKGSRVQSFYVGEQKECHHVFPRNKLMESFY